MNTARTSDPNGPAGSGAVETQAGSPVVAGRAFPRVVPPFAFEAEEFDWQFADQDWRHRLGVPQVLDFPVLTGWAAGG